jgi:hypothetical protein
MDLRRQLPPVLCHSLCSLAKSSDLILFSGNSSVFQQFHMALLNHCKPLVACLIGSARLWSLKQFKDMSWVHIKHLECGGTTASSSWVGSSVGLRDGASDNVPASCTPAVKDLLEFAPANMNATVIPVPSEPTIGPLICTAQSLLLTSELSTFWSRGLFPVIAPATLSKTFVAAPSPFTTTKWCCCQFTAKEIARFVDLPVEECEKKKAVIPKLEEVPD